MLALLADKVNASAMRSYECLGFHPSEITLLGRNLL
jgi:hypothetical protein